MRLVVVAGGSVVLFFPTFWLLNAVVGQQWGAGIAAFAMYVAFPALALRLWRGKGPTRPPTMEQALARGELAQEEYDVNEVYAVEEEEDEGLHFYLAVGFNRTLFLSGQYLYEPVESGSFPSSKVRLHWHKTLGLTYGVECLGLPITPSRRLPPFTVEQMRATEMPEDRQVLQQPIGGVFRNAA